MTSTLQPHPVGSVSPPTTTAGSIYRRQRSWVPLTTTSRNWTTVFTSVQSTSGFWKSHTSDSRTIETAFGTISPEDLTECLRDTAATSIVSDLNFTAAGAATSSHKDGSPTAYPIFSGCPSACVVLDEEIWVLQADVWRKVSVLPPLPNQNDTSPIIQECAFSSDDARKFSSCQDVYDCITGQTKGWHSGVVMPPFMLQLAEYLWLHRYANDRDQGGQDTTIRPSATAPYPTEPAATDTGTPEMSSSAPSTEVVPNDPIQSKGLPIVLALLGFLSVGTTGFLVFKIVQRGGTN
ncbi:hypothetical protein QFC21_005341 [Naganishia friedmannii]|uniref:Uncharacterized protein n=1 Tax=Naganishia friedmannii TaxID=89922 RepID=A0ACC2V9D7_9TREE|nr:hypothetical protein QFC21_005341 [Naganishia friedmannii]